MQPFDCGEILSVESHRSVPAPFLTKTFQLVDDPSSNDIVSWGNDGSTFIVWRPPEFASDLLPNYFKHNNFSSFVRQLNTYGFRKVVPDRWEFANEFFRKGEKHMLCEIHRRKTSHVLANGFQLGGAAPWCDELAWSPAAAAGFMPAAAMFSPYVGCIDHPSSLLREENERLRRDNSMLSNELIRLQRLYDDALNVLQQQAIGSDFQEVVPKDHNIVHFENMHHHSSQGGGMPYINNNNSRGTEDSSSKPYSSSSGCTEESLSSITPKASTIAFVDVKLREMAATVGPKLFGVSLQENNSCSSKRSSRIIQSFLN